MFSMNELLKKFKDDLSNGQTVYGLFAKSCDPAFIEVAGYAGFDFVILDMEHGLAGFESLQNLIRASQLGKILPLVRVPDFGDTSISKALDAGSAGIQVPQVACASDARKIIKASKFHPSGERGMCRFVRAAKYSAMERTEYFKQANDNLVVLQVEGKSAVSDIDNILDVEGVDVIFIGPYDLSQSLGYPGQIAHPEVVKRMEIIVKKVRSAGKVVGTFTDTGEHLKLWRDHGVQYLAYSVDVGIFYDACAGFLKSIHF